MCMNRLWQNLNFFAIRVFLVSILLIVNTNNFLFDYNSDILLIVLFFIIVYDIIFDIVIQLRTRKFNYDELIVVSVSLLLFFTSQFRVSIVVVLFYQILNRLLVSFLKYVNSIFVGDFLVDEDSYVLENKKKVRSSKILVNQNFYVNKGQVIPVDGIIQSGTSIFKSPFSRDNQKIKMTVGGRVLSGMINTDKKICMKATTTYQKSLINKLLLHLKSENSKYYELENAVNKFVNKFILIIILVIAIYMGISYFCFNFTLSSLNVITILLISTTFISLKAFLPFIHYVSLYKLTISGIIVKNFDDLSKYCCSNLVILNKTGVGTVGEFRISEVVGDSDLLFKYLNYAEAFRSDKIAKVIREYKSIEVSQKKISNYEFFPGEGISLKYDRDNILVGNYYLFKRYDISVDIDSLDKIGTVIYVSVNRQVIGYIVISDLIKTSIIDSVLDLRKNGFNVIVMSGDNSSITCAVTREIQASECYSSLLIDEREFFIDYVRDKYKSKSFYISDRGDDYFLTYNDFGITLNREDFDNLYELSSEIVFIDDDISRIINLSEISKRYKNSIIVFFSFFIFIRLVLLILALMKIIDIGILMFGELILIIIMLIIVLRIINDAKEGII